MVWRANRLTQFLRVRTPIIQAGMAGGPSPPALAAAVSSAGGLGTLGAANLKPEAVRQAIRETKQLTDQPFAVNLFVSGPFDVDEARVEASREQIASSGYSAPGHLTREDAIIPFEEQLQVVLDEHVPYFSFTFGIPSAEWMTRLKDAGIGIMGTATTVEEARMLEDAGCDAIVAQGYEAGGHRGTFASPVDDTSLVGTMVLVPQVVDAVKVPVIAAGGIMDGRGIAAALALGAEGVQLGTAFLTTDESGAAPVYKKALLSEGRDRPTMITRAFSGRSARGIRNTFIDDVAQREAQGSPLPDFPVQNVLTRPMRQAAEKAGDWERMSVWAGQGFGATRDGLSAADLLHMLEKETDDAFARVCA